MALPTMNFRALFDNAPDGILVVNAEGLIEDANPRSEELFGYSVEELRGASVELLVPEGARRRHVGNRNRYWREPMTRPMGIGMELAARRKDGSEFPVEISLSAMQTESGMVTLATVRDMTHRKRLRDFGAAALRAAENVRMEIARDLHDDTAQQLSAHLIHGESAQDGASSQSFLACSPWECMRNSRMPASAPPSRHTPGFYGTPGSCRSPWTWSRWSLSWMPMDSWFCTVSSRRP